MLGWLVAEGPQRRRGEELKQEGGGVQVKTRRGTPLLRAQRKRDTLDGGQWSRDLEEKPQWNFVPRMLFGTGSARMQWAGRAGQGICFVLQSVGPSVVWYGRDKKASGTRPEMRYYVAHNPKRDGQE